MLSWRDRYLKKLKDRIQNAQSRRSGEKSHHIYETYKNTVMPHGRHIYAKASDMANDTENKGVSLAHELKIIWKGSTVKMVPLIKENQEKDSWKENGQKGSIIFSIIHRWKSKM